MSTGIEAQVLQPYKYGFVTDIEADVVPPGLSEDVIRLISAKKGEPEWMLEWRLRAYRNWLKMPEPHWANVRYGPIDYQAISYYAAPKKRPQPARAVDLLPDQHLGHGPVRAHAHRGRGGELRELPRGLLGADP